MISVLNLGDEVSAWYDIHFHAPDKLLVEVEPEYATEQFARVVPGVALWKVLEARQERLELSPFVL